MGERVRDRERDGQKRAKMDKNMKRQRGNERERED